MLKSEYEIMYKLEDGYWWYSGLRDFVHRVMSNLSVGDSYGFDFSDEALKFCRLRKLKRIVKASVSQVPFKNNF